MTKSDIERGSDLYSDDTERDSDRDREKQAESDIDKEDEC